MKTDYLIALFAIAGTGLGNPLAPSNLAVRAESSADEALVKELCLNMPAAASEEQKRACNSAFERVKRGVNFDPRRKFHGAARKGGSPFCKSPHRRAERGDHEGDEAPSADDDVSLAERDVSLPDSDLSRRFPQDEADGGDADESDDSADATAACPKRDEEASEFSKILSAGIKAKCSRLPANAPAQFKALCEKYKAKGGRKRGVAASASAKWEKRGKQGMTDDGEESDGPDDEGLEKRAVENAAAEERLGFKGFCKANENRMKKLPPPLRKLCGTALRS